MSGKRQRGHTLTFRVGGQSSLCEAVELYAPMKILTLVQHGRGGGGVIEYLRGDTHGRRATGN